MKYTILIFALLFSIRAIAGKPAKKAKIKNNQFMVQVLYGGMLEVVEWMDQFCNTNKPFDVSIEESVMMNQIFSRMTI